MRGAATVGHHRVRKAIQRLPEATQEALALPDLSDTAACEKFLCLVVAEIRAGLLPPSLARAINELLCTRVKINEMNTGSRLNELEALLKASVGGRR